MGDNSFHTNNQINRPSEISTSTDAEQSSYTLPGKIDPASDQQESIQNFPQGSQTKENQPNQPMADVSQEMPIMNTSMPSGGGLGKTIDTWLDQELADEMRSRWNAIQVQFVDSPCSAVEQGDALVAEVMETLRQIFADQQTTLNQQWLNHDDITTEELRITLQNYRSFLNHLLKI